jgi:hypothetical protein
MKCSECQIYSFKLQRCKLGKINPKTIKGGVEAANLMGLDYICSSATHREKIAERLLEGKRGDFT